MGGPNSTYYFDDIAFLETLSTPDFEVLDVKIYPNPVTSLMTIEANGQIENIYVYNLLGQEVLAKKATSNSITIQTDNLLSGVYVTKTIMVDGSEFVSKFLKLYKETFCFV